jgi:hypothetical protein
MNLFRRLGVLQNDPFQLRQRYARQHIGIDLAAFRQ